MFLQNCEVGGLAKEDSAKFGYRLGEESRTYVGDARTLSTYGQFKNKFPHNVATVCPSFPQKNHFVLVARAFYLSLGWEILPETETLVKNYNMNILTSHVTTLLNYTIS